MAKRLEGTGVLLILADEMPADDLAEAWPEPEDWPRELPTPEERAERASYERGEIIYVGWHVFADVEYHGQPRRVGGSWTIRAAVRLDEDPTSELLEIAHWAREGLGTLLGDLRRGGMDVTRWEFYSAPFRIELSERLRKRLAGTWRERGETR